MSICSTSARALSRSRLPPTKTLLPFLYQTPTIQQWQSATQSVARRNIISPSRPHAREQVSDRNAFYFEDEDLPPAVGQAPPRKTTITGTERAAFQKLYRKFETQGRQQKEKDHVVELDQIADEYYEDDEDHPQPSLDKVFDQVLTGEARLHTRAFLRRPKTKTESTNEPTFKKMRLAERERVDALIRNAPTDRALWQTLDREVFTRVRELDLDNASNGGAKQAAPKPKSAHKPDPLSADARALFQNYPHHLVTGVATLRAEFPSSPLPFSILPTIKKLGRSSYALGATTKLYKLLIRAAWIQQSSYATINALLTEMNDGAIEFDTDTIGLLDAIIREHNMAKSGVLGTELALVYNMDMYADGLQKIITWRDVIAQRLGLRSGDRRAHSTLVRRVQAPLQQKAQRGAESQSEGNHTQRSGAHREESVSEYIPFVEGVDQGADGSSEATASAEDGERNLLS
ncbi:hypothetical protein ACET3X_007320 [Alternaria dauci]|uniref:Mtf2-like C-terminal domain-containing protein n=1 Tax=Alternaria dauci TaxID=48095 RepID=A0ABR3UC50_9PLEO